jgi:hypothetical protein
LLRDSSDGRAIEVEQSAVLDDPAEKGGVAGEILLIPIDVRREIGLHSEQLRKVDVDLMEGLIERRRSDHDHFEVERYRLRTRPRRR